MSLINNLIRQAKAGAKIVEIRPNQVNAVATHARLHAFDNDMDDAFWRKALLAGKVKVLGAFIRVLGKDREEARGRL